MAQVQFMRERRDLLPRTLEIALFLLGLGGIAALFLPFILNNSPWDVTGDQVFQFGLDVYLWYFLLGAPFLLAIPISAASLLLIITRRLVQPCWIAAYVLGLAAAGCTLYLDYTSMIHVQHQAILFIPALLTLVGGGALVISNARLGLPHALNSIVAMQAAYVAGALPPMIAFFRDWDIGAYITLVTIAVYFGHIAMALSIARRPNLAIGR